LSSSREIDTSKSVIILLLHERTDLSPIPSLERDGSDVVAETGDEGNWVAITFGATVDALGRNLSSLLQGAGKDAHPQAANCLDTVFSHC
jgi:hypothetical protein